MANEIVYELKVDASLGGVEDVRKRLQSFKEQIIGTENEIKKLKSETKGNAEEQIKSAGTLSILETRLKGLRDAYQENQRQATGVKSFTQKVGEEFAKSISPLEGFMTKLDQLGPIGQSLSGLVGKVQGVGNAIGGLNSSNDKLAKGLGQINGSVKGLHGGLDGVRNDLGGLKTGLDGVSGGLGKVGGSLGELHAKADQSGQGISKLQAFTGGLGKAFGGAVLGVGVLVGALAGLGVGITSSIEAYDNSIKAQRSLEQALGHTSEALLEQAGTLQDITGIQDDAITKGQAFAASLGLTEEQILKITPAVLDLAAATGQDVNSAFESVASTLVGGRDALKKYGVEIDHSKDLQTQLGQVLDGLNSKFKGQAEAVGNAGSGGITKFRNAVDDLEEGIGRLLITAISPFVDGLKNIVNGLEDFITPARTAQDVIDEGTASLRDQQAEFNGLILKLEDANTSETERHEIIEKLNTSYKDYLPNLISDKTSNEELSEALKKGNDQFVKRIALQSQASLYEESLKNQGKLAGEVASAQVDLNKRLIEQKLALEQVARESNIKIDIQFEGKSSKEQIEAIRKARRDLEDQLDSGSLFGSQGGADPLERAALDVSVLSKKQDELARSTSDLKDKLAATSKILGFSDDVTRDLINGIEGGGPKVTKTATSFEQLTTAVAGGAASLEQMKDFLAQVDGQLKGGSANATELAETLKAVNSAIAGIRPAPENDAIRKSLIAERDALQKQIDKLNGQKDKSATKTTTIDVAKRTREIENAYDLEIALIDRFEADKITTEDEANVKRLEATKKFLDDRAKLIEDKAKEDGKITTVEVVQITGVEAEAAKVEKEIDDARKRIAEKEAVKVHLVDLATDKAVLQAEFNETLAAFDEFAARKKAQDQRSDLSEAEKTKREKDRANERIRIVAEFNKAKLDLLLNEAIAEQQILLKTEAQTGTLTDAQKARLEELKKEITDLKAQINTIASDTADATSTNTDSKPADSPLAKLLGLDDASIQFYVNAATDLAQQIEDVFLEGAIQRNQKVLDENLRAVQEQHDTFVNGLQAQLDAGQITQQQFDSQKLAAEQQQAAKEQQLKKQAFEKEKKIKRAELAIELVLELARIAASAASAGPAAPIQYALLSGLALARYAFGLVKVNQSTYAKGGQVPTDADGVAKGPSHSNGGIPFSVKNSPVQYEMEGGEFIVNRKATKAFLPQLRQMNATKFAAGGAVPGMDIPVKKQKNPGLSTTPVSLLPADDLVTSQRQVDERRRVIQLPNDPQPQVVTLHISDLERKQERLARTQKRLSYGT